MPKFVLAPGATPLDHLTDKQISDLISQLTGPNEKLNQKVFSFDEKWAIYNQLVALGDDTGWPVTRQQRNNYVGKFTEAPKEILIPAIEVQKFFVEMKKLGALLPSPTVNEFALRFHLGESGGSYSAVLIPMYGQIPVGGVPSSRLNEKEKEFFTSTGTSFFALLFTDGPGAGFCTDEKTCADAIVNIDSVGKESKKVAYFTEDVFSKFHEGLIEPYENLKLEFARTESPNNFISLVLSFINSNGDEVECDTLFRGIHLTGFFFDQGDLIPPPPSDNIIRDTFFPR